MADDFSGSLTPPDSPGLPESLDIDPERDSGPRRAPGFCSCAQSRDGGRHFSPDSYLAGGCLKRLLLRLDPFPTDYETDTVEIFGFQWVTETALVESAKLLFGLLRQQIHRLENLVETSSFDFGQAGSVHCESEAIRHQCLEFLHYVKVFIFRYIEPQKNEDVPTHPYEELEVQFPSLLVEEMYTLTLYIGRVFELPSSVLGAFTIQNQGKLFPPAWHLLHLHLDIQWSVLEILHILGDKMHEQVVYAHQFMNLTGENLTNVSLFEDHCAGLLCDLITLSVTRFTKVRLSDALTIHHYPCMCVKEMWILLIQLLNHRSRGSPTESFWNWLNRLLQQIFPGDTLSGDPRLCDTIQCKDPLSFSWWIVTHLALLHQFDRNGSLEETKPLQQNWKFVEELLKKSSNVQDGMLEDQLRMHLLCCLTLCGIWESNLCIVTIPWDYYSKNLNSSFNIPWLGLKGLASVSKTPFSMLEVVKRCCGEEQGSDLYSSESSFHIFLRILAQLMKKTKESSGSHPWKQIKGRIYSKFHQRRMQELTEVGLQNFFSLFLVLAAVADIEDVASRVLDLLAFLAPVTSSTAQRALVWRGQFAFLLTYVEKKLDISVLAEKLSISFRETAKKFLVTKNDYTQKQTLWTLLSTYIEGVQEVFETSCHLQLSEEKLLNDGFSMLLPACGGTELGTVLYFLQVAVARIRSVHSRSSQTLQLGGTGLHHPQPMSVVKEHHLAVASELWKNFFPYLKNLRLSQTPPPQLADTAAGFALLALDMPTSAPSDLQPQPVLSMMQLFGWDDMVCPQLVSRYLSHLLENSYLSEALCGTGNTSAQALSVRAWSRSVLQIYADQTTVTSAWTDSVGTGRVSMEQLTELTRLVFKLPEVESILSKAQIEPSSYKSDPKAALIQFIKAAGKVYSDLQTLAEKSSMVSRSLEYLGDVLKYVKPYLVKKGPAEGLQLTYRTFGCLIKYWALMLATSKAQQLLFRIIDVLLLPHAVFQQDKELPPAMLSAIRESLPLYLQGLCAISRHSSNQGTYIKQQLRSIIQQYFGRFLPASPPPSGVGNHPVLQVLCDPSAALQAPHLRKCTLQVISENYIQFKGHSPPSRLVSVLAFLLEILQRAGDMDVGDVQLLLPPVLKCLLLVNEPQVRKLSTDVLQQLVEDCQVRPAGELHTHLTSVLRKFVQDYSAMYDHQLYSILEMVAVLDQTLVISLIPTITQSLKDSEHKRGLGRNAAQRESYRRLLSHLGESGQCEMLALESETS
ncbi:protein MMS22-like [Ambystoma mexicanum]|uniref:protein MMS22-like n=1 Tax=Ambystoma mexicanum TaxID=8296 RepID=UPI0037E97AC3